MLFTNIEITSEAQELLAHSVSAKTSLCPPTLCSVALQGVGVRFIKVGGKGGSFAHDPEVDSFI